MSTKPDDLELLDGIDLNRDPSAFGLGELCVELDQTSQRLGAARMTRALYPEADEDYPVLAEHEPALSDRAGELWDELERRIGELAERVTLAIERVEGVA